MRKKRSESDASKENEGGTPEFPTFRVQIPEFQSPLRIPTPSPNLRRKFEAKLREKIVREKEVGRFRAAVKTTRAKRRVSNISRSLLQPKDTALGFGGEGNEYGKAVPGRC